jgi:glycosyltransferase involved in cell wall biosynthesis
MKKIAFFIQHMLCGGVENSLIYLTSELYSAGYDVTIYMISETGDFMKRIPKGVKQKKVPLPAKLNCVLPVGGTKLNVRQNIAEHHYIRALVYLKKHIINKSGFAELNIDFDKVPKLNEQYDIAVNFHMHSPFLVRYLSDKVIAKRKFTWIHNDFLTTGYDIKQLHAYLKCCDKYYCVSQQLVKEFTDIFPEYESRTFIAYNMVPVDDILKKAEGDCPEYKAVTQDVIKLLSVGRLEHQKGYDLTVKVCRRLVEHGLKFKWFILGDGSERKNLEQTIKKLNLQDTIYLLGSKMNPYPYFKDCDIYVQTSRHEGYVTTVTEAKIFNRPIVCTDVSGAREQIENGHNGYITNFEINEVESKIEILMRSTKMRNRFEKNSRTPDSADIKNKLLDIFT